jgi:hypothetical protein
MPDSSSVQPILDAAEQAAAAGDLGAAGELLRQAVQLQEIDLGPHHPDLANTLNNLGVVCEKTGRLGEAERCYRRAYEIAAAGFEPDHPFVITSRKNLADFCEAHGKAIEPPPAAPVAAPVAPPASPPRAVSSPTIATAAGKDARLATKQGGFQKAIFNPLTIALIAVLVLAAIVIMRPSEQGDSRPQDPSPATPAPIESGTRADAAANTAAPVATDSGGPSREAAPRSTAPVERPAPSKEAARDGPARASAQPIVAEAQVCRRFSTSDWRCEEAGSAVAPGSLVYFTRIKAARATTVEHRWYHGEDLQQRVLLDVGANPGAGYRTYSRLAVSATGRWRVEVRTTGGTLLHEERFNVR